VTAVFALAPMSDYGVPFHEALVFILGAYTIVIIIVIFGMGCAWIYEKLGNSWF